MLQIVEMKQMFVPDDLYERFVRLVGYGYTEYCCSLYSHQEIPASVEVMTYDFELLYSNFHSFMVECLIHDMKETNTPKDFVDECDEVYMSAHEVIANNWDDYSEKILHDVQTVLIKHIFSFKIKNKVINYYPTKVW
jgi:hypothetical protein